MYLVGSLVSSPIPLSPTNPSRHPASRCTFRCHFFSSFLDNFFSKFCSPLVATCLCLAAMAAIFGAVATGPGSQIFKAYMAKGDAAGALLFAAPRDS